MCASLLTFPKAFSIDAPAAGEGQATRDAAVRDGAVFQEDIVKKRSKLVRLSSSAYLGLPLLECSRTPSRRPLTCGWGHGVVAQTPPSWCAWWRNHLQRLDNNPNYQQAADRESCFQRIRFKSNPFVFGQTESPTHRKHVRTKRNMSRTFFFSRREPTSSSDLTQKTPNYQRRYLSSQRLLSADVINLSDTSARRQAWQPPQTPPNPPNPPLVVLVKPPRSHGPVPHIFHLTISFFSLASLLFPFIFCFWEHLFIKNCLSSFIPFIFQTNFH